MNDSATQFSVDPTRDQVSIVAPSADTAMAMSRAYLRQIVGIHFKMFEKLLFDRPDMPRELAELFEEVGQSYLQISEMMNVPYTAGR